jgi:hypothetical protein
MHNSCTEKLVPELLARCAIQHIPAISCGQHEPVTLRYLCALYLLAEVKLFAVTRVPLIITSGAGICMLAIVICMHAVTVVHCMCCSTIAAAIAANSQT